MAIEQLCWHLRRQLSHADADADADVDSVMVNGDKVAIVEADGG
jgi:hypothetical protein